MLTTLPRSNPHVALYLPSSDIVHWPPNPRSVYIPSTAFSLPKYLLLSDHGYCSHVGWCSARFTVGMKYVNYKKYLYECWIEYIFTISPSLWFIIRNKSIPNPWICTMYNNTFSLTHTISLKNIYCINSKTKKWHICNVNDTQRQQLHLRKRKSD